jgi:hypothetical protein
MYDNSRFDGVLSEPRTGMRGSDVTPSNGLWSRGCADALPGGSLELFLVRQLWDAAPLAAP